MPATQVAEGSASGGMSVEVVNKSRSFPNNVLSLRGGQQEVAGSRAGASVSVIVPPGDYEGAARFSEESLKPFYLPKRYYPAGMLRVEFQTWEEPIQVN
jgi:hypothetical protein